MNKITGNYKHLQEWERDYVQRWRKYSLKIPKTSSTPYLFSDMISTILILGDLGANVSFLLFY